jgi:putative sigma-54 modulation protein
MCGLERHYTATAQLEIRGPDLVTHAQGQDPYSLLDTVVAKLDAQLRKRTGKRKGKRDHPQQIDLGAALPKVEPASDR